jgi:hypothetical protein
VPLCGKKVLNHKGHKGYHKGTFRLAFLKLIINMMMKKVVLGGVNNFERC